MDIDKPRVLYEARDSNAFFVDNHRHPDEMVLFLKVTRSDGNEDVSLH
jgi:hypothetical protein